MLTPERVGELRKAIRDFCFAARGISYEPSPEANRHFVEARRRLGGLLEDSADDLVSLAEEKLACS